MVIVNRDCDGGFMGGVGCCDGDGDGGFMVGVGCCDGDGDGESPLVTVIVR